MIRKRLFQGSLAACTLAMAATPVLAQQNAGQAQNAQTQSQSQKQDGQTASNPKQSQALEHFLAGYYAGYVDGWSDGAKDLVITVLDEHQRRSQTQAAAGRNPARMQSGRAKIRTQLRGRMSNQMRGRQAGTRQASSSKEGKAGKQKGTRGRRMVHRTGKILALKMVSINGTEVQHRVARVKTNGGRVIIVELGPKSQTDDLGLKKGDTIKVHGSPAMSGDVRILVAKHVTSDGQKVGIEFQKLNFDEKRRKVKLRGQKQQDQQRQQEEGTTQEDVGTPAREN